MAVNHGFRTPNPRKDTAYSICVLVDLLGGYSPKHSRLQANWNHEHALTSRAPALLVARTCPQSGWGAQSPRWIKNRASFLLSLLQANDHRLKDAYRHDPTGHIENTWEKAAEERTCWIQQMHLLDTADAHSHRSPKWRGEYEAWEEPPSEKSRTSAELQTRCSRDCSFHINEPSFQPQQTLQTRTVHSAISVVL